MVSQKEAATTREVALIVNLRARFGEDGAERAIRHFKKYGVRVKRDYRVRTGRGLIEAVGSAVESGLRTVVIGGGDGTLSTAVDLLANRDDLTVGLLPLGTGNEMAAMLGIPCDMDCAARVVAEGRVASVDLAQAGSDFFIHTALIGYPAHVNHRVPVWLKRRFGRAAYLYMLLASIPRTRPFHAVISAGDTRWEGETVVVAVGNGRFHAPAAVLLPRASVPQSGLIAYTPRDYHFSTLLRLAVGLWITHRRQSSLLWSVDGDEVKVITDTPQSMDLDGERTKPTPAEFRVVRRALRVLVPGQCQ